MDPEEHLPTGLAAVAGPRFLEVIDALGFGAALMAPDLRFLDVSPRLSDLLGRSVEELRSLADPATVIVPERRHMVADRRASLAVGEDEASRDEVVLVTADGARIPVEFSSTTLALPDGGVGVLAICRDLRAEVALDDRLARLSSLVEVMPLGLMLWDGAGVTDPRDLRLAAVNTGASRMVGVDLAARIGGTLHDVFPQVTLSAAARLLALAGTERVEKLGDLRSGAGTFRWHATGLPGPAIGVLFQDITHERSAERERRGLLERLVDGGDDERRRLAVAMHDDPVQKIAAATLLVEALRRHPDAAPPVERLESIETTLRSAMAALRQLTFELSPPELAESGLEAAVATASAYLFEDSPVEVAIELTMADEPAPVVQTAAFRIVAEALTNVRKHAQASTVAVRARELDGMLEVSVVDDGVGLPSDAEGQPGHLGLRTMRERAGAIGGSLRVVDRREGGVSVTARLPLGGRLVALPEVSVDVDAPTRGDLASVTAERDSLRESVAAALERARLAEDRLRSAFGVTKAMLEPGLSTHDIAHIAVEQLGRSIRDGCVLHLLGPDGAWTRVASWHLDGTGADAVGAALFGDGPLAGHVGTVARSGEPMALDVPGLSAIVAPLLADGVALGLVTVTRDTTAVPYDRDDVELLVCLADRVAIALSLA